MINCIIGSIIGTLIGIVGSLYFAEWRYDKMIKKIEQLIEDANTFKVTLKNEI